MATVPILVEVEDIAVGPVMIALRKMQGVISFHVDLDKFAPSAPSIARVPGANIQETVTAVLLKSYPAPIGATEVSNQTGLSKTPVYGALNALKGKGLCVPTEDRKWVLTEKAALDMGALKLLPNHSKPDKAAMEKLPKMRADKGRAKPGETWAALHATLKEGGRQRSEVISTLASFGVKENSASGILERAQRDKLAKTNGTGLWELTPKGLAKVPAHQPTGE
jgi:hypothetical protein